MDPSHNETVMSSQTVLASICEVSFGYILHFQVSKNYEINHACWLRCILCIYKISFENMTIGGLCKKEKMQVNSIMCNSHIIYLFFFSRPHGVIFFDENFQMHEIQCNLCL
jgi:hypothetical protein